MSLSKRREPRSSSSISRQILRQIIGQNSPSSCVLATTNKSVNLDKFKYDQAILFLQKKVDKQSAQITALTEELSREYKNRQQNAKMLVAERERTQKLQNINSTLNKNLTEVKKKCEKLETQNKQLITKRQDVDGKLKKMRDILRKKEEQVCKFEVKVQENTQIGRKAKQQVDQIKSLREAIFKLKFEEEKRQNEKREQARKLLELQKAFKQREEACLYLEESNSRLQDQIAQLEGFYNDQQNEAKLISSKMQQLLEAKEVEIDQLRTQTQRFKQVALQDTKKEPSVYINEINRILRDSIRDKSVRVDIEKKIKQVVIDMDEGWNRILLNVIATK